MNYAQLKDWIEASPRTVFFGGAGVSTESGIPDFRSENGIFKALEKYGRSPETLLSRTFFDLRPDVFFTYTAFVSVIEHPYLSCALDSGNLQPSSTTTFASVPAGRTGSTLPSTA